MLLSFTLKIKVGWDGDLDDDPSVGVHQTLTVVANILNESDENTGVDHSKRSEKGFKYSTDLPLVSLRGAVGEELDLVELDLAFDVVLPPGVELLIALPVGTSILDVEETTPQGLLVREVVLTIRHRLMKPGGDLSRGEGKTDEGVLGVILNISFGVL